MILPALLAEEGNHRRTIALRAEDQPCLPGGRDVLDATADNDARQKRPAKTQPAANPPSLSLMGIDAARATADRLAGSLLRCPPTSAVNASRRWRRQWRGIALRNSSPMSLHETDQPADPVARLPRGQLTGLCEGAPSFRFGVG